MPFGDLLFERRMSRKRNIQISRVGCDSAHRTFGTGGRPGAHANNPAALDIDLRNLGRVYSLVFRPSHLELCRKIDPELKTIDAFGPNLRHLFMHDSTTGGHPLNISRANAS